MGVILIMDGQTDRQSGGPLLNSFQHTVCIAFYMQGSKIYYNELYILCQQHNKDREPILLMNLDSEMGSL